MIVGPVPGIAPNSVPISVPRTIGKNACFSSALLGRMSRRRTFMPPADDMHPVHAAQEVGDAEHAERQRHQFHPVGQLGQAECEALRAAVDVGPDDADQQADHRHRNALQR